MNYIFEYSGLYSRMLLTLTTIWFINLFNKAQWLFCQTLNSIFLNVDLYYFCHIHLHLWCVRNMHEICVIVWNTTRNRCYRTRLMNLWESIEILRFMRKWAQLELNSLTTVNKYTVIYWKVRANCGFTVNSDQKSNPMHAFHDCRFFNDSLSEIWKWRSAKDRQKHFIHGAIFCNFLSRDQT